MIMNYKLINNPKNNQVEAYVEEKMVGICKYTENNNTINIIHTSVDSKYQGQGIAKTMVEFVIKNVTTQNKTIKADCSYAKKVIDKVKDN